MFRGLIVAAVCFVLLPFAAPADTPTNKKPDGRAITVPLEVLRTKHLAIMARINGKGPYRMIFDTGAPLTLVSSKVARESGMIPPDAKRPPIALFGALGQFPIQSLEVGEAKVEKVPAMVMDHPGVTALAKELGPLEGIVGFPFFGRFTMKLDYQAGKLTLQPNGYEPGDIMETLTASLLGGKKLGPVVVAPAGQWGLIVKKNDDDKDAGVSIDQVHPGSAADKAGLQAGDRLLSIDSRWTESVLDCYRAAATVKAGSEVPVVIRRDGKEMTLRVRPRPGL
jgi:membrane-associated protease RseP (regulator of RpoE activity)